MDARQVARTGVCARVMPVQLLAVGSHGGKAHGDAVFCASLPAGLGHCNYVELIYTIFTDVEGVD
jgi:hypothetical protein